MKQIKYLFVLALMATSTSCSDYLDVPPPGNSLTTEVAYSSQSIISQMMNGMYALNAITANYASSGYPLALPDQMGDNYYNPSSNAYYKSVPTCNINPSLYFLDQWGSFYSTIYTANGLIENLPGVSTGVLNLATKNSYLGAAYTWRAWIYFCLADIWGGVPLVLTTKASESKSLPRASLEQVYAQIEKDLKQAISLLPATGAGDPTIIDTQAIPQAILAKLYLEMGNYAEAEAAATSVINSGNGYILQSDLSQVFLRTANGAPNKETVFSYGAATLTNTSNLANVALKYAYLWPITATRRGAAVAQLTTSLLAEFEVGDQRYGNWSFVPSTVTDNSRWAYKYKQHYLVQSVPAGKEEDWINIRLAEVYLIRAEARAQQGNVTGAAADVSTVRKRAKLEGVTASNKADMLTAILHERRIELFGEGKYWGDLRRFGLMDQKLANVSYKKTNYKSHMKYMPLSTGVLVGNPILKQTEGYPTQQ